jgi:lipoprotein-anchoring transpeptidase ErfK/SrfK
MPGAGFGGLRLDTTRGRRFGLVAATIGLLLALIAPLATMTGQEAGAQEWSAPRTVYVAETGQTLDRLFLDAWREGGGAASYGNPISPEITNADGTIVQYLEYARFEYHPDAADGSVFVIANIGEELRPFSVQRSVSQLTSTGGTASVSAEIMSAWVPVDAPVIESARVRYVEATQHTVRYAFLDFWEATGEDGYLGNPITEQYIVDGTTYQVFERGQLAWKNGQEAWMVPVGKLLADKYQISQEPVAQGDIPTYSEDLFIPPPPTVPGIKSGVEAPANGERWIEINLTQQYMIAWQGDVAVMETYVSTGTEQFATPPGTFYINSKVPSQTMDGVLGGEDYNVPDVPDVMYFTDRGHAIHGAYWHNNFGAPMSHGCVNVPLGTSTWLYEWASTGTRVEIQY